MNIPNSIPGATVLGDYLAGLSSSRIIDFNSFSLGIVGSLIIAMGLYLCLRFIK